MGFSLDLPGVFNAANYFVDRNVHEGRGDKVAVVCEDRRLTYRDIQKGMNRFGNVLKGLGVRIEERVALLLFDTEIYPQAFFGAIKAGAVPVCLNTLLRPTDYETMLNDCRARVLVADAELLQAIEPVRDRLRFLETVVVVDGPAAHPGDVALAELMAEASETLDTAPTTPDDACFWLFSSGSTGRPKGVVHLQHDMVFSAETYARQVLGITADDICFSAPKLFFAYGLGNGLYFPFSVGATAVYLPGRPTPQAVFDAVAATRPTLFFAVPTLYGQLLEADGGAMDGVRLCISAGEALPPELQRRWTARFGLDILDGIGSTEMCQMFISNRPGDIRPGSTGRVVPGYEARIVDEDMHDVAPGEVGTLLVKGDSAAAFYWNQHEKTKQTMLGAWINTGDKFLCDAEGYYYYAGRSDDMMKIGGIWVSPIEVEAAVVEHPAVLECAVVPAVDGGDLVKPKAFIVLKGGRDASSDLAREIQQFVKANIAHYKYPRWVEFVDELPKTPTGKIKRFELRQRDADAIAGAA